MNLGMYIMTPEPISTAFFVKPHPTKGVLPSVGRQLLGEDFTAAANSHAAIEELVDMSVSTISTS
jgi:hypothetical protein